MFNVKLQAIEGGGIAIFIDGQFQTVLPKFPGETDEECKVRAKNAVYATAADFGFTCTKVSKAAEAVN